MVKTTNGYSGLLRGGFNQQRYSDSGYSGLLNGGFNQQTYSNRVVEKSCLEMSKGLLCKVLGWPVHDTLTLTGTGRLENA